MENMKAMIMPIPGLFLDSLSGLCKRIEEFNPEAKMSAQALRLRINNASSSRLMKGLFIELLQQLKENFHPCEKLKLALGWGVTNLV